MLPYSPRSNNLFILASKLERWLCFSPRPYLLSKTAKGPHHFVLPTLPRHWYNRSWRVHELTRETVDQNLLPTRQPPSSLKEVRKSAKALFTGHESWFFKNLSHKRTNIHKQLYFSEGGNTTNWSCSFGFQEFKYQGHLHLDKNSWGQVDPKHRKPFLQRHAPCDTPRRRRDI